MKSTHFLCSLVLGAISATVGLGQSTASLSGTVTDPSGAVVAHAHVIVHSLGTGLDRTIDTDDAGLYVAPSLLPGDYSIHVTAQGFGDYNLAHPNARCGPEGHGQYSAGGLLGGRNRAGAEHGGGD